MKKKNIIFISILVICLFVGYNVFSKENNLGENYEVKNFKISEDQYLYDFINQHDSTIILFWSSYCPHCEKVIKFLMDNPHYTEIQQTLITVSNDHNEKNVEKYKDEFIIHLDLTNWVAKSYELQHIPTIYIVDNEGKIIHFAEGGNSCVETLKEYIGNKYE